MSKALTVESIERIKPTANRREIADGLCPGLYLVVQPSGVKSWVVRYRFNGRPRKHTLGRYPTLRLGETKEAAKARIAKDPTSESPDARTRARIALRAVAIGQDPQTEKTEARLSEKLGLTKEELVGAIFQTYDRQHLAKLRPSTSYELRRLFTKRVLPRWQKRRIKEIEKRDVIALVNSMVEQGAAVSANRMVAALSHFFNWCVDQAYLERSPSQGVKKPTKQKTRDRVLSDEELRWLWLAANDVSWPFGPLTKLLILTGTRLSEVSDMPDSELNMKARLWTIPGDRAKNGEAHGIHLTSLSVKVIDDLPRIKSKAGLVFTTTGETPVSGMSRAKRALDLAMLRHAKEEAKQNSDDPAKSKIAPWVMHDLRRTMATGMARLGIQLPVIERCLNHVSGSFGGVAGIYQRHDFAKDKVLAFEAWSEHIGSLLAKPASKSKVKKVTSNVTKLKTS